MNVRNKGANGEREVVNLLEAECNTVCEEICSDAGIVVRMTPLLRNTHQYAIGGEDISGLPWYSVEVKRCEKLELGKWWMQTTRQACVAENSRFRTQNNVTVTRVQNDENNRCVYTVSGGVLEKIPLLFYRQNHRPWAVMLFGFVATVNDIELRTTVEISLTVFCSWLRIDLRSRLASSILAHPDFKDAPPDFQDRIRGEGSLPPARLLAISATEKEKAPVKWTKARISRLTEAPIQSEPMGTPPWQR